MTPAIDRNGAIFDGLVSDPNRRFWSDATFFTSILAGTDSSSFTGSPEICATGRKCCRNANYMYWYLNDDDGLYFRNMRLWAIDDAHAAQW